MRKKGSITVEAAVVLGMYLTILGSFMVTGCKLYMQTVQIRKEMVEISATKEVCTRKRQMEFIEELIEG